MCSIVSDVGHRSKYALGAVSVESGPVLNARCFSNLGKSATDRPFAQEAPGRGPLLTFRSAHVCSLIPTTFIDALAVALIPHQPLLHQCCKSRKLPSGSSSDARVMLLPSKSVNGILRVDLQRHPSHMMQLSSVLVLAATSQLSRPRNSASRRHVLRSGRLSEGHV